MTRRILALFSLLLLIAAGLGFYALHLKTRVAREEQTAIKEQQNSLLPANGKPTRLTLYVASDLDGTLRKTQVDLTIPEERSEAARSVLRALLAEYAKQSSLHRVGPGADIRDVYLLDDGTAIIDTTTGFADEHPSGVLAEELTVASLVTTLNANDSKIERVKILVNGQERDTLAGHADLRRFYDVGNVKEAVKDLQ